MREREPISRAEISRETALQRSTVSTIVESLKADGLIEEIGVGESTGGRRPTLLRLRTTGIFAIGVDITPTLTNVAACNLAGRVLEHEQFPTDPCYERTIARVLESVREMNRKGAGSVEGVGVSLPGLVDPCKGRALFIPWFKWRDVDVAGEISSATDLPVMIDNDANSAALAELWFGRPEVSEVRDFIMVFVGEGIGTGIVFDGQVYRGEYGAAGEFGHMVIGQDGPVACSCGNLDCWEAFSSGRAASARYLKYSAAAAADESLELSTVVERALAGEEAAKRALVDTAHYLGIGISNLVVGLSPQAVVVGGAITRAWDLVSEALKETIARSIRRGLPSAHITPSTLGEHPTMMGALSLVLATKFASANAA